MQTAGGVLATGHGGRIGFCCVECADRVAAGGGARRGASGGEQHGIEVRSYSPREVKACVAGYGHADKKQMQTMVKALLCMEEIPEPSDAADALAVALCYLQAEQLERRFGVSKADMAASAEIASSVAPAWILR